MPKKFVPRQRKHKVLARQKAQSKGNEAEQQQDPNALEILPAEQSEVKKQAAQLRAQLNQDGVKVSSKKAKRLEKYIENKLKKDENRELLQKLAANKVDTSLFSSSRALGQGKETKREAMSRVLREREAGLADEEEAKALLYEEREEAESEPNEDEDAKLAPEFKGKGIEKQDADTSQAPAKTPLVAVGAGLKRPLETDESGRPVIAKRQKRGGVKTKISLRQPERVESESDSFEGFSSDGDNDMKTDSSQEDESEDNASEEDDRSEGSSSEEDASEDAGSEDDEDEDDEEAKTKRKEKSSAFKAWATQQRNESLGFKPTTGPSILEIPKPANFKPRPAEQDPLPLELQPGKNTERKAFGVAVTRDPDIQAARLNLPVVAEEQKIMEAIHNNDIVVICGATGSGKTTQVPQFLFEAGYGSPDGPTPGMIGVTQPRRVAAVSMAKRVGVELGDHGKKVAYQIRFEGTVDAQTAVKFMTDGVLLREVAQDIALKKYSAIIVDEAHERSVNTDILIGMLSRVIKLRAELAKEHASVKPLKLIIMSATLRIDDMTKNPVLFSTPPPVIEVEGRQHPVTIHFARRTRHDYVEEAFRKISRGHKKLPPGGFLVFLTGQNEIVELSKKLKAQFGGPSATGGPKVRISANEAPVEVEDIDFGDYDDRNAADMDDDDAMSIDGDAEGDEHDPAEFDIEEEGGTGPLKMQILPLYSLLPTKDQMKVFEPPPEGYRQVIIATNVAETSLTIPGIRYVFDCGRSKERRYDPLSGVQSFEIGWISKASANQRSGRAGRTGPGHCYRLYSSAVYERDLPQFADPELLRMPIEGVVLQLKAMNLQHVVNFPFPTPPDRQALAKAERLLSYLQAVSSGGQVTQIGQTMSIFPLSPRFARILLVGHLHDCLPYTIALVAGLSAPEVFIPEHQAIPKLAEKAEGEEFSFRTNADVIAETAQANVRKAYNMAHKNFCFLDDRSDAIKLLQAVGEFAHEPTEAWCEAHFVRFKTLREIQQLRRQLVDLLRTNIPGFANLKSDDKLDPPSPKQVQALKQMVAAGFIDQVAIRADKAPVPPPDLRKPRRAIDVPYLPLVPLEGASDPSEGLVYIHPSSPLAHLSVDECPDYVVYSYLQRAGAGNVVLSDDEKRPKTRMHALTDVTGGQLAALAKGTPLIGYGKPIKEVKGSEGEGGRTREVWVVPYLRAEGVGGMGWPLPARKVRQRKVPGKGWVVE